jgi:hypothetical protein
MDCTCFDYDDYPTLAEILLQATSSSTDDRQGQSQ